MRKSGIQAIFELAKTNADVMYIGSDIGYQTLDEMKLSLPNQFVVEGISEAHVIGMAAGLAMSGKIPYVNTIATFLTRRCYDQLANDVCLANLKVRLYANGGGLVYGPLGPTHLAIEDIAILRALPNMSVIVPADPLEMRKAILASDKIEGPIYFRVARGGEPQVTDEKSSFDFGKATVLEEPREVLFVATGVTVSHALQASKRLKANGIQAGVINLHTLKPVDRECLIHYMEKSELCLSIEEHSTIGGLGSIISEIIASETSCRHLQFKALGIPDVFPDKYGTQKELLPYYGLDAESIVSTVKKTLCLTP